MRWVAMLLIGASLTVGSLSAMTAYLPTIPEDDGAFLIDGGEEGEPAAYARLDDVLIEAEREPVIWSSGPEDADVDAEAAAPPAIVTGETRLTPAVVALLRERGVQRVRVDTFRLAWWPERWYFLLSCVGLVGGAVLLRRQPTAEPAAGEDAVATVDHAALLGRMIQTIDELRARLATMRSEDDRLREIVATLGEVQRVQVPDLLDAKPVLMGRLGLSGYAELMDRFAGAERQINRAWSAAADGVYGEAFACLVDARGRLEETARVLS